MYSPIEGGSSINIQGLECNIPPVGYVVDIKNKSLRKAGVYSRSDVAEEQYWERIKPPSWYFSVLKEEEYYKNPKPCKRCGCEISYEKRKNKFCSRSCGASYNNIGINRHVSVNGKDKKRFCLFCGSELKRNKKRRTQEFLSKRS